MDSMRLARRASAVEGEPPNLWITPPTGSGRPAGPAYATRGILARRSHRTLATVPDPVVGLPVPARSGSAPFAFHSPRPVATAPAMERLTELSASLIRAGVAEFVGDNSWRSVLGERIGVVAGVVEPAGTVDGPGSGAVRRVGTRVIHRKPLWGGSGGDGWWVLVPGRTCWRAALAFRTAAQEMRFNS